MAEKTPAYCCYAKEGPPLEQLESLENAPQCRSVQELAIILEVSRTIEKSFELHDIAQPILRKMQNLMGLQCGAITLVNRDSGELSIDEAVGLPRENSEEYLRIVHDIAGKVIATGQVQVVDVELAASAGAAPRQATILCVPIRSESEMVGTMSVERAGDSRVPREADQRLVSMIASLIGQAVRVRHAAWAQIASLRAENERLQDQIARGFRPPDMVGTSSSMRTVYYHIEQVAGSRTTVLIRGESGTGKELVAKALHENSDRKSGPFVKFNCAALPDSIIESELFGHEKGAFTGALAMRKGRFEIADKGTIFLDEIGDISPTVQTKLLRVLQEREIERVGSQTPIRTDVRIIAATSRDLEAMIAENKFRADLYYRLNVFPIYIPPLRERKCDILLLADHFIEKYATLNKSKVRRISSAAIDLLATYHWPGNVRELENCIERAVILAKGDAIMAQHLPPTLQRKDAAISDSSKPATIEEAVDALEREMIVDALKDTGSNMAEASRRLGLTERKMGLRVQKYGIDLKRFKK
ncbi:MAG TPA: sigma 54-interacting transcriptional regulator [Opitutales bacterium]|nr:sigma 54-interacting transcriptional regulator [Opitutales bacterium]